MATFNEQILSNLKAAYLRLSSREVTEVEINGRRLKYADIAKLKAMVSQQEEIVKKEKGIAKPKIYKSRFI